ncbi:hypothetical protein DENSPDRAFT_853856 [Dentipellis sp. KUC8613]|nr:hypothetical protein DENSPDRAFT_853856 [Dentipellis sp. KUC8613]
MYSSRRTNSYQPYSWTGSPDQVSGSSSHAVAPPATAYSRTSETHAGYPTEGRYSPVHEASFQSSGNPTLHPFYDPHPDQFTTTLESAFPHLRAPQIGSTGGSPHQEFAPANLGTNFPHSSYSELANYAGDYCPARGASGAAQPAASSVEHAAPPSMSRNPISNRHASVAEPSVKGQKRKSRKGATDALAIPQGTSLGSEHDGEHAKKKKKAIQQRGYRAQDSNAVKQLADVLPDPYKVDDGRRVRETIFKSIECIQDFIQDKSQLQRELEKRDALLQDCVQSHEASRARLRSAEEQIRSFGQERLMYQQTIHRLQGRVTYLESGGVS